MRVLSLPKAQVVKKMRAWEKAERHRGEDHNAWYLEMARESLEATRGDNLRDIYGRAEKRAGFYDRIRRTIADDDLTNDEQLFRTLKVNAGMALALGAGTSVATQSAVGAVVAPMVFVAGMFASIVPLMLDIEPVSHLSSVTAVAGLTAGLSTGSWLAGIGATVATGVALIGAYTAVDNAYWHNTDVKWAVNLADEYLEEGPALPDYSRQQVAQYLTLMTNQQRDQNNHTKAANLAALQKQVEASSGADFTDLYLSQPGFLEVAEEVAEIGKTVSSLRFSSSEPTPAILDEDGDWVRLNGHELAVQT